MTGHPPAGPSAPTVFAGGRLFTPGHAPATALVVASGRISYVGDDAGARSFASGADEVDLAGRLVTPAFVDAHVHAVQTGQVMTGLQLSRARSRDEVLDALAAYARQHPGARVIVGQGWEENHWVDPRPPLRTELDRAGGGAPVYLSRVDVHSAVVSSALLQQVPGIEWEVGYDASGLLTRDAHHRCRVRMSELFSDAERRAAARVALQQAARVGIAAVHELGGPHLGPLEDLVRIRQESAALGMDCVTYWGELAGEGSIATARSVGAAGLAGDLCVDGAIGSRTAALAEPYADFATTGARYLSTNQITEHVIGCTRAGLQAGFHCIGDDAVGAAVEGLRRAAAVVGVPAIRAARHRLEHVEMLGEDDMPTLAELGVVASMQPTFDTFWGARGDLYERRLGRQRSEAMNRFGTLHRHGVALAFGSDSPVTPLAGWATVRAAVRHHQPAERLDALTAFDAATRGAHWAAGDDSAGTLTPGSRASFAVWDTAATGTAASPEPWGLPDLVHVDALPECVLTVASGRVVFASDPYAG